MAEFEIQNTVVLITGAARGIGAGVVRAFLEKGAKHVAILDLEEVAGLALEEELNSNYGTNRVKFFKCDVTNEKDLLGAFDTTIENIGPIDVVINNAGIMNDSQTMYKKQIDVNLTALTTGTLKALKVMRKDKGGNGGTVINISSIAGLCQQRLLPIYSATKAAVLQFSNCIGMGDTYSRTGVRVVTICLGATNTALMYEQNTGAYDDERKDELMGLLGQVYVQRLESAVRGIVDAFMYGSSGSTWLATRDKPTVEITQNIKDGYTAFATHMS